MQVECISEPATTAGATGAATGGCIRAASPREPFRRRGRQRPPAQLPSRHADVALSALRDTPGRDSAMLGLPSFEHRLRRLPPLPPRSGGATRLLRPGPPAQTPARRRDPAVLGGRRRRDRQRSGPPRRRTGVAARDPRSSNGRSTAPVRGGRAGPRRCRVARPDRGRRAAGRGARLEPVGRRRGVDRQQDGVSPAPPPRPASMGWPVASQASRRA